MTDYVGLLRETHANQRALDQRQGKTSLRRKTTTQTLPNWPISTGSRAREILTARAKPFNGPARDYSAAINSAPGANSASRSVTRYLVHDMTVVTRNEADFKATGASLIRPWSYAQD
jgi:hypothetical protein